jgi:hypothetical protein
MMSPRKSPAGGVVSRLLTRPWVLGLWCTVAAFGAYASMYGFRKPFTAATFGSGDLKSLFVTTQLLGYMLSKFIGIKVVAEMTVERRARTLLGLILVAELALLGFALTPATWAAGWLFVNGLMLGMVFGLVLGFVEGRRLTEMFVAGLCASFILADGFTKTVGGWLLAAQVPDQWMPFIAGLIFLVPLGLFVWMLRQIPAPDGRDEEARTARVPMTGAERMAMVRRHWAGLSGILVAYLLVNVVRSVRADFAPEIWKGLGFSGRPEIFTLSELWIGVGVALATGAVVLVKNNRTAFYTSLGLALAGLVLSLAALTAARAGVLAPFPFMVLLGLGMYLPYVSVHTTVFERLIALTRERANLGYLMYLADSAGYLGTAVLLIAKSALQQRKDDFPGFFLNLPAWLLGVALVALTASLLYYIIRRPEQAARE